MAGDEVRYESKSVRTVRGLESRTVAKLEKEGWEFVSQASEPLLRTKLTFRRQKKKVPWYIWAAGGAVVVALVGIIVTGSILERAASDATSAPVRANATPSAQPSPKPTPTPELTRTIPVAPIQTLAPKPNLTVNNNKAFAALVRAPSPSSKAVAAFAKKYKDRIVEFDGNIAYLNKHDGYSTRFDFLINAGDYSETASTGPNFQFRDVSAFDLHLRGKNVPDNVGTGDNIHIVARIKTFSRSQDLFFLEPISTKVR